MVRCARLCLAIGLTFAGCQQVKLDAKSMLAAPQMGRDSVVLDLFFVRLPHGDERLGDSLWRQIDEQAISADVRQRLWQHGFRAGVCGLHPPAELDLLLTEPTAAIPPEEQSVTQFAIEPLVLRRHLQAPAAQRSEIITSGIYDSLPLLEAGPGGEVSGQTYRKAQGVLVLTPYPEADGRVRLVVRPELQHGEPRRQFLQREGHLVLDSGRPRKIFEDLAMETHLAAGQMLLIGSLAGRRGSPGHYFFTEPTSEGLNQKLLIVRLSQTRLDPALGAALEIPDHAAP
jgi:hypothetical protein